MTRLSTPSLLGGICLVAACVLLLAEGGAGARRRGSGNKAESTDEGMDMEDTRNGKLLSMFNLVKFKNDACAGDNMQNGTCYTQQECDDRDGSSSGTCAEGFGVCCIIGISCGGKSSENNTYFDSTDLGSERFCEADVCPCNSNICQLRLDFVNFVITGPATTTLSIGFTLNGVITPTAGASVSQATQCLTDSFSVSSGSGITPPTICGMNTGQHMYVDADMNCNSLRFGIGANGVGTSIATGKGWSIKVSQYTCDFENLAPVGCTQYYYGEASNQVQTYNYHGGIHLANQNQKICVRREKNICSLCWTPTTEGDFMTSGGKALSTATTGKTDVSRACCNYGPGGNGGVSISSSSGMFGYDCALFSGAVETKDGTPLVGNHFCGVKLVTVDANTLSGTVCTRSNSFSVSFISDNFEYAVSSMEAMNKNKGFELTYIAQGC